MHTPKHVDFYPQSSPGSSCQETPSANTRTTRIVPRLCTKRFLYKVCYSVGVVVVVAAAAAVVVAVVTVEVVTIVFHFNCNTMIYLR